mgnify:CR=1 FL=1
MKRSMLGTLLLGICLVAGPVHAKSAKAKSKVAATQTKTQKKVKVHRLKALQKTLVEELKRNWATLQKLKLPRVYYMVYRMKQAKSVAVAAKDGVIVKTADNRKAPSLSVNVNLRVGNHKFDNTGKDGNDYKIRRHLLLFSSKLPYEVDNDMLRRRLWLWTDRRYKQAMAQYSRKRYVRNLKVEIKDKSGDFSKEAVMKHENVPPALTFNLKHWKKVARELSSFSATNPHVINSSVSVSATQNAEIMVDSDGSRVIRYKTLYKYAIFLTYLSPKKEYLNNYRLEYVDKESKLPNAKRLKKLIKVTLAEVVNQGNAAKGIPVEAPAILMPDVSGVLFHEALGHRLEAQRMLNESDGRTFRKKIGQKVIPTFLSVFDDPTIRYWGKTPLNGHYHVDYQGVKAQRVTLIKDGILRGFLLSRKPIDKFLRSNGHGRALFGRTPVSRMGSLLIKSKREYTMKKLREMLIAEAKRQNKPHAFIIDRSSGGYTHTGTYGIQSFKNQPKVVYQIDVKTGKQTLVKGLEIIGTPLTVVNNILATGKDYGVFNGHCGAESGWVPVSAIAPSLLLKTVELQRVKINQKKPYLLPPPFAATKKAKKKTKADKKKAPKKTPAKKKQASKTTLPKKGQETHGKVSAKPKAK